MYNDKEMIELFGFPFYFVHGTNVGNLLPLIKKEKIHSSTEVENDDSAISGFGGNDYVYCTAVFKGIDMPAYEIFMSNLIISPKIMLNQEVIFNSRWIGSPMQTKEQSEENINNIIKCLKEKEGSIKDCLDKQQENYKKIHIRQFTVYLMPEDPPKRRKFKLKLIKYFIEVLSSTERHLYTNSFEFLFANNINLNRYLTHTLILKSYKNDKDISKMIKIIKKRKRKYIIKYIDYDDTVNKHTFK